MSGRDEQVTGRASRWLASVLFVLLLARLLDLSLGIDRVPKDNDEASHLENAYFYKLYFIDRDFTNDDWNRYIAYDQPPVSKYVFGSAIHLLNGTIVPDSDGLIGWHRRYLRDVCGDLSKRLEFDRIDHAAIAGSLAYCDSQSRQITSVQVTHLSAKDYRTGRQTSLFFAGLSALVLAIVGWQIVGQPAVGLIAALVLLSTRVTIPNFQQAATDSLWCFLALSCLSLLLFLFRKSEYEQSWREVSFPTVLVGICLGLAIGTKLIAAFAAIAAILIYLVSTGLEIRRVRMGRRASPNIRLASLAVIGSTAVLVFIALNPFLYQDPWSGLSTMIEHRKSIMQAQAIIDRHRVTSIGEQFEAVAEFGLLLAYAYSSGEFVRVVYGSFALLGIITVMRRAVDELSDLRVGPYFLFGLWALTAFLFIGFNVHVKWLRYFLPCATCSALFFAIGAHLIAVQLNDVWRRLGLRLISRGRRQ